MPVDSYGLATAYPNNNNNTNNNNMYRYAADTFARVLNRQYVQIRSFKKLEFIVPLPALSLVCQKSGWTDRIQLNCNFRPEISMMTIPDGWISIGYYYTY